MGGCGRQHVPRDGLYPGCGPYGGCGDAGMVEEGHQVRVVGARFRLCLVRANGL